MNKFTTKAENRDTGRKICTLKKITEEFIYESNRNCPQN